MSKGIILYQSKYGSAKKYAQWLEQEIGYVLMETKKAELHQLSDFDVIVLGGGVYASGIAGLQFLKKNIGRLSGKKIAVFAVGASPYDGKAIQQIRDKDYPNALRNYGGDILLVGINYDERTKRHTCQIEKIVKK